MVKGNKKEGGGKAKGSSLPMKLSIRDDVTQPAGGRGGTQRSRRSIDVQTPIVGLSPINEVPNSPPSSERPFSMDNKMRNGGTQEADSLNAVTTFEGYKVKAEVIPVLRKIFDKYGDIAKDSSMRDPDFLMFFLEKMCWIVKRLENARFSDITADMVEKMCGIVQVLEKMEFNVGWLHTGLTYIKEVHDEIKDYPAREEERTDKMEKEKARLVSKQREVRNLERKVKAMEHEIEEGRERMRAMSEANVVDCLF